MKHRPIYFLATLTVALFALDTALLPVATLLDRYLHVFIRPLPDPHPLQKAASELLPFVHHLMLHACIALFLALYIRVDLVSNKARFPEPSTTF